MVADATVMACELLAGVLSRGAGLAALPKCVHRVSEGQIWASSRELAYLLDNFFQAPPVRTLLDEVVPGLDVEAILRIASVAEPLGAEAAAPASLPNGARLKIGYFKDAAFSFYHAENLEALERSGADLVAISPLAAAVLPADLSALYIGGGFPEVQASALAANSGFLRSLQQAAQNGLPIYAECGGLMVRSRAIVWQGSKYPMAAGLSFEAHVSSTAQGHGYAELLVDHANPFYAAGLSIRGHEFHYSKIVLENGGFETACEMRRGKGIGRGGTA